MFSRELKQRHGKTNDLNNIYLDNSVYKDTVIAPGRQTGSQVPVYLLCDTREHVLVIEEAHTGQDEKLGDADEQGQGPDDDHHGDHSPLLIHQRGQWPADGYKQKQS